MAPDIYSSSLLVISGPSETHMPDLPIQRVSATQMRALFNARILPLIHDGSLHGTAQKSGHPSPVGSGQPYCTRSQYIVFRESSGTTVAEAHQYLLPDGTIGASGLPDPKLLVLDGILYLLGSGL